MRKMRNKGSGGLRSRGKDAWEIKIDLGKDPLTGKAQVRYHSFKGSKRQANEEVARLISAAADGNYVDPTRSTVADFFERWEPNKVSPKTRERYQELIKTHIRPRIGEVRLQKLDAGHLNGLYATLLREGRGTPTEPLALAPRTVGHIHRLIHRALRDAVKAKLLKANPASVAEAPSVDEGEVQVLNQAQVRTVLERLRGRSMFLIAATALATGARRGELCALRWKDVDFERGELQIERSLEQTKAGLRFKAPKTKRGRRRITLPAYIVAELRAHWKTQQEQRLALGVGKDDPEALVFRHHDGSPVIPNSVTTEWRRLVKSLKLPKVTFHALRHTHVSQLIDAKLDILTISRRIGHSKPSITLNIYGHLMKPTDGEAAAVFEAAYAGTFRE